MSVNLPGGVYKRTELWVHCSDPNDTCPLEGRPGFEDAWDTKLDGSRRQFMAKLRHYGWRKNAEGQLLCPDCAKKT